MVLQMLSDGVNKEGSQSLSAKIAVFYLPQIHLNRDLKTVLSGLENRSLRGKLILP